MTAPQIIILVLFAINLLVNANMHDKPRTNKYNFFTSLISISLNFLILYWGGFFK